ncbi:hypothetical protein GGS26DRAFT_596982 [Hypomontagnella submonticulosa]|nr:hypothetical protein GGS26DRAFT_596982 [Hypomontagnella submonticulosa]
MKLLWCASLFAVVGGLADARGIRVVREIHSPFSISKFNAGATPHSSVGYIELNWSYSGGLNQTTCSARPGTYQVFPSIGETSCSDPSTSFNLTRRADGGADLGLTYKSASKSSASAVHFIPADEIIWTNQQSPTGAVQIYAGPQNFTVDAVYPGL